MGMPAWGMKLPRLCATRLQLCPALWTHGSLRLCVLRPAAFGAGQGDILKHSRFQPSDSLLHRLFHLTKGRFRMS